MQQIMIKLELCQLNCWLKEHAQERNGLWPCQPCIFLHLCTTQYWHMHYLSPYSMMQREHIHILFILPILLLETLIDYSVHYKTRKCRPVASWPEWIIIDALFNLHVTNTSNEVTAYNLFMVTSSQSLKNKELKHVFPGQTDNCMAYNWVTNWWTKLIA